MRRVVLDTNVFLDCWVFGDATGRPLRAALEQARIHVLRSHATDSELCDVLERVQFGLAALARTTLLEEWQRRATLIEVPLAAPVRCTDPADQKFLDLALAGRAHILFTKDKALLATAARARPHGLHVVAPTAGDSALLFENGVA